MQIFLSKSDLLKALKLLKPIISKVNLPILRCVKVSVNKKYLTLAATDLETYAKIKVKLNDSVNETFSFMIELTDLISSVECENTCIEYTNGDSSVVIDFTRVTIDNDVEDFPAFPKIKKHKIVKAISESLIDTINKTVDFCSNDSTRPALCGINFTPSCIFATNGYIASIIFNNVIKDFTGIIPSKSVNYIKSFNKQFHIDQSYNVYYNNDYIKFEVNDSEIIIRLIDELQSKIERVIPKKTNKYIVVDKQKLSTLLKQTLNKKIDNLTNEVDIAINENELKITVSGGNLSWENGIYIQNPKSLEVSRKLNGRYFMQVISELKNELCIEFGKDSHNPIVIYEKNKRNDILRLLMPLRSNI